MRSFFETIADIYDDTRSLPKSTMKEIIVIIADELKHSRRVLDLGVGTGRFAEPLSKKGIDILGVDISEAMIKKAQLKDIDNLILGDACVLPFKDSSFDSIICVHVLHLIENCDEVLREIKRVGGEKLLSVINKKSQFSVMDEYKNALSECNFKLEFHGVRERDIKEKLLPEKKILIEPFRDIKSIGERLILLEKRKHSYTYNTPNQVHECAIAYLKNKFIDELDLHPVSEIEVVEWNIADLPDSFSI